MRELIESNKVTQLAIPRLGCGLDKLDWGRVKNILIDVFKTANVSINVFELLSNNKKN